MALLFSTKRAPYVVKVQDPQGPIQREVPWREATAVRTATREDLVKILVPVAQLPTVTVQRASVQLEQKDANTLRWLLTLELYMVPSEPGHLVIPNHDCWARVSHAGSELWRDQLLNAQPLGPSHTIRSTWSELIINGPGAATYLFSHEMMATGYDSTRPMDATMYARPADSERPLTVDVKLTFVPAQGGPIDGSWQFVDRRPWER